jgi:RNA polymerase sigma-70 factor (ECF subfamily)
MDTHTPLHIAADRMVAHGTKATFTAKQHLAEETPLGHRTVAGAIARAKEGDHEAIRYLYLRYSDNVYGYIASIVRDEHEAEDITQHVFAKLMTAIRRYEQREVPFASWLLRLARNAAVDHLRRRVATPIEEVRGANEHGDERYPVSMHPVGEALAALPADQRTVVVLRHVVGLSPGEIAKRMGRSEHSIHGLHHRGRRALQVSLRALDCGPATVGSCEATRARRRPAGAGVPAPH